MRAGTIPSAGPALAVLTAMLAVPAIAAAQESGAEASDAAAERGRTLYERWCLECHGETGEGDGPAADRMLPRPRNFVEARYQIRTTESGSVPTDRDLTRVIRDGLNHTAMPGWPSFSRREVNDLAAYLKSLSRFFQGPAPEPMEFSADPGGGTEAVAAGREIYQTLECYQCHGQEGRGDGSSAPTLEDWREFPIRAADLTEPWLFNGGPTAAAIHARFLTGMDGTPMPSNQPALQAELVTEDDLWHLAHYVRSLGPDDVPPEASDAVRVVRVEEGDELPSGPADSAWAGIPRFYFPLAGQVIQQPRQFMPMVDGVWVQGAHDGEELVLRVTWNEPSESPDSAWAEWQRKVAAAMDADGTPLPTEPLPDRLALQFPTEVPAGRERPYFLMGSTRAPVYLWRWSSTEGFHEATASGLGTSGPLEETRITGAGRFERGQWRVTFRRALAADTAGTGPRVPFPTGVPVPVAFFAWDGNNGEDEFRGAISSWYFVILEEPVGNRVWIAPLVAVLLTGGLGLWASRRARRRYQDGFTSQERTS